MVLLKKEANRLVPDGEADPTALLRARTLLAYLMEKNLLHYERQGEFVVVHRKGHPPQEALNMPNGALAGVLYQQFASIAEQPAVAFYRSNTTINRLFNKVWLRSSLKWLDQNATERIDLDIAFGGESTT